MCLNWTIELSIWSLGLNGKIRKEADDQEKENERKRGWDGEWCKHRAPDIVIIFPTGHSRFTNIESPKHSHDFQTILFLAKPHIVASWRQKCLFHNHTKIFSPLPRGLIPLHSLQNLPKIYHLYIPKCTWNISQDIWQLPPLGQTYFSAQRRQESR